MELNPTTMMAGGGVLAILAAGWRQLRTAAQYLSSFVVLQATFNNGLTLSLGYYLKSVWRPLPSGLLTYVGEYFQFRDRPHMTTVPFRVTNSRAVYRLGWRLLMVHVESNQIRIWSLRGMIDFDNLLKDALLFVDREAQVHNKNKRIRNFQVLQVMGQEKSQYSMPQRQTAVGGASPENPSSIDSSDTSTYLLDTRVDKSFMYEKSQYIYDNTVDPFANLYYPPEIQKYIDQAHQWFDLGQWYTDRCIPWRRGWLLYGPGGTGKSSLAKAVAQSLGIRLYNYHLATLSNQEFVSEWNSMATPCMALFEDFDNVFDLRENLTEHKSLSFDTVLNQISGVNSHSGVFLVINTNHLSKIDPALGVSTTVAGGVSTRPGRIDTAIYVGYINEINRRKMAQRILRDWPEEIEPLVTAPDQQQVAPVQFMEACIQVAFHRLKTLDNIV